MNRGDDFKNSVGFDADVVTLEKMLLGEDRQLMFISIVGESGVGKRTLGKVISAKMKGEFHLLIRFTVPPECSLEFLLHGFHDELEEQCEGKKNVKCGQSKECTNLKDKIRRLLRSKMYLLVLGGIGSIRKLNCIRASLPDNNNGSRVVLTLDDENDEVAWHANTMNREGVNGIHHLSRLDKERSGKLFRSRAFRKEQSDEEGYMGKYDQIVYDITGGYPHAIVILAGLLRFKERPGQWEAVLQQLRAAPRTETVLQPHRPGPGTEAQEGEANQNQIAGALLSKENSTEWQMSPAKQVNLCTRTTMERVFWASFEDLPNDLKSCFLYFAAFAKNIGLYADEIVRMWIGEGFIKPRKGKTMEEMGHVYLKELVLRCLVEILLMVDSGIKVVRVHPNLHGLLQSEVLEAGFVDIHDMNDVFVPPSVRRLSFRSFDNRYITFTNKLPKLRSFMCRVEEGKNGSDPVCHDLKFLSGSKYLRLIYVNGLRIDKLPHRIGDMIHLRYLYVRCKDLKELPSSIKGLLNLQTLDIRNTQVEKIDPGFWKIKTLRHVLAENLTLPETLDEEVGELQTLHGVKPAHEGKWNEEKCPLYKMTKLRSLRLKGFQHARHKTALKAALKEMCFLVHLRLQGDVIPACVFTVQGLEYLQTIELDGTVRWPKVSSDVRKDRPNLIQLTLTESNDAELEKMGFMSLGSAPVYRRSNKQEERVAAKQNGEHQDEASSSQKEHQHHGKEAEAKPEYQGPQGPVMQNIPPSEPPVSDHASPLPVPGLSCDAAQAQSSTPGDASGGRDKATEEADMDAAPSAGVI